MSNLLVVKGPNIGIKYSLEDRLTVGRAPENAIQIPDPNISRVHCEFFEREGRFHVRDCGSKNGVLVNNEPVEESPLNPNDEIALGTTAFLFDTDFDLKNARFSNKRVYFSSPNEETIMRLTPLDLSQAREQAREQAHAAETRELIRQLGSLFPAPQLSLPEALEGILRQLLALFDSRNGCLMTWDDVDNEFVPLVSISERDEFAVSLNVMRSVLKEKQALLIPKPRRAGETPAGAEGPSVAAVDETNVGCLCVPLISERRLNGLLYLEIGDSDRLLLHDVQLLQAVANMAQLAIERAQALDDLAHRKAREKREDEAQLIGRSPAFLQVLDLVDRVAGTDSTVLITGETGTGKEMIARELHRRSKREKYPFLAVNCAAIPENLIEAELFGHERGAFTGADRMRRGLVESAHGGTLFLDEVGEMSLSSQTKLLRFLQERVITRVGGSRPIRVDVRVVAATNVRLEEAIARKAFREDLWYRLNVFEIHLPPLRERVEDIAALAEHFVGLFSTRYNKQLMGVNEAALNVLRANPWPGNVREFVNAIERAVLLSDGGRLEVEHFASSPAAGAAPGRSAPGGIAAEARPVVSLEEAERECILRALESTDWNQAQAARILKIHRNTLRKKISDHSLERTP